MDIGLLRRLLPRVDVIPVIGKADSLTPSELKELKKRCAPQNFVVSTSLMYLFVQDIEYVFPSVLFAISNALIGLGFAMLPFAVTESGDSEEVEINGEPVRARGCTLGHS